MKIVCDACQAKYSISDDKVQGKVFKIRCKKCSNIIVVRGGANAAEAAPPPQQEKETHVYDYGYDGNQAPQGDESVWHIVINQDQVGPMTAAEIGQRFAAGEIDGESYIWREGFTDWLPLSQVDTFAQLAAGGGAAMPAAGGRGGHDAVSSMFGGGSGSEDAGTMRSDPGDLFAAASASSHASNRGDDDSGDLFGGGQSNGGGQAAAQGAAANSKLRGERNENSVLFSLNNLAQLASDKPAANPGVTSMPSGHATGAAGGEGSGLIDIRSMASAYLGSQGASAGGKATTASIGTIDDLPVFGGTGFSEPAVIVPTAQRGGNNKILYAMIGAVGLLAVAAVIMVVVLLGGKNNNSDAKADKVADNDKKPDTSGANGGGSSATTPTPPTTPATPENSGSANTASTPTTPATNGTGSAGSAAPQVALNDKTKTPTTTPAKTPTTTPAKTPTTTPAKTPTTPAKTPDPKTPTTASTGGDAGGCDEVSCLLGTASGPCCAKFKKGAGGSTTTPAKTPPATTPPATSGGDLPETLDRDMISNGIGAVAGAARSCGGKFSSAKGKVKVHVKVSPGGSISGVDVSETPDPGLGNCVAGAVSHAHFAKTQKGGSFSYPFVF